MKKLFCYLCLLLFVGACNTPAEDRNELPDPITAVRTILEVRAMAFDSVAAVETDSTYAIQMLPRDTSLTSPGQMLYGEYSIEKGSILKGDINGDGQDDAVVQYRFTPHRENNTLVYFKVLVSREGEWVEIGEIYGGGRCEGPVLVPQKIAKGVMLFEGLEYAAGDPCCCPSLKKPYGYALVDGKVIPSPPSK